MKPVKPDIPPVAKTPAAEPPLAVDTEASAKPLDLGIAERRKLIRTLPVPLAVESERDSDWDRFQTPKPDTPSQ